MLMNAHEILSVASRPQDDHASECSLGTANAHLDQPYDVIPTSPTSLALLRAGSARRDLLSLASSPSPDSLHCRCLRRVECCRPTLVVRHSPRDARRLSLAALYTLSEAVRCCLDLAVPITKHAVTGRDDQPRASRSALVATTWSRTTTDTPRRSPFRVMPGSLSSRPPTPI